MNGLHKQEQFLAFSELGNSIGFGRIRQADFRSRATLKTAAAQEAAADVAWTISFLGDTATNPLAERTKEPALSDGQALPNEYMLCFRALTAVFNQQLTTYTEVELMEICDKLGECVVQVKTGTDIVLEKGLGYMLQGRPGVRGYQGTLAAGAATGVRAEVRKQIEGLDLDDPIVVLPGGSMSIIVNGEGAWTTTDDVILDLFGHGWIALHGSVSEKSKVLFLQDALKEARHNVEAFRVRARV